MQGATAEVRNSVSQAAEHIIQRQQRLLAERTTIASSAGASTVLLGIFGPIGGSAVVADYATWPQSSGSAHSGWQGTGCYLAMLGTRLEDTASCGRCREEHLP